MRMPFDVEFPVTQRFGEKITDPAGHKGIDYALYQGTPVLAVMDGKVSRTAQITGGYGTHVVIDHDGGLQTVYAHLSRVTVPLGAGVLAGQLIGYSGNTGNSTGPHLHFEVRADGKAVDPEPLLHPLPPSSGAADNRRVRVPLLYVRSGPGTEYPIVDSLRRGEQVSGNQTAETVWLRIGPCRWIAVRYQGEDFCETASWFLLRAAETLCAKLWWHSGGKG